MRGQSRILDDVARACGHLTPHPGAYARATPAPSWDTFAVALRAAGAEAHGPVHSRGLAEIVAHVGRSRGPGPVRVDPSLAPDLGTGPWESIDPEARGADLADTKLYIARGIVGVAEDGAVAVPLGAGAARAALFLCEHLLLVLDPSALEADLHRGVERLARVLRPGTSHVWISGPSKTADIEQALVLGAHGPRSLDLVGLLGPGS